MNKHPIRVDGKWLYEIIAEREGKTEKHLIWEDTPADAAEVMEKIFPDREGWSLRIDCAMITVIEEV